MQECGGQARRRAWGVAVFGGFSGLLAAAVPAVGAELSPAQVVEQRFPASWGAVQSGLQTHGKPAVVATRGATPAESTRGIGPVVPARTATPGLPAGVEAYFNPNPASRPTSSLPALSYADPAATPASGPGSYQLASASSASEKRTEPKRAAAHSNNVFNDSQIASIKERLNLSPAQIRLWPQVEAALRGLVYKKPAAGDKKPARTLDPASPEVERLKTAALPLVLSFNSEQKQELRTLAHLIGLGNMVAQF
jgi:hypothetical protein